METKPCRHESGRGQTRSPLGESRIDSIIKERHQSIAPGRATERSGRPVIPVVSNSFSLDLFARTRNLTSEAGKIGRRNGTLLVCGCRTGRLQSEWAYIQVRYERDVERGRKQSPLSSPGGQDQSEYRARYDRDNRITPESSPSTGRRTAYQMEPVAHGCTDSHSQNYFHGSSSLKIDHSILL